MRILITGATGFVGRNLINKIKNHNLALIVRDNSNAKNLFGNDIKYINFNDSTYKSDIEEFNPEMVIHLASYLTSKYETEDVKNLIDANIMFGTLLLDALMKTDLKYFINTGSFSEYYKGNKELDPAYLYSATKIAFRTILDFYRNVKKFNVIQVVPYTIYGNNDTRKKLINYIITSLESSNPINMTKGDQILDFIYVTDVVDFYINLIENINNLKSDYVEYHVGTGVGTSIREVAKLLEEITNKKTNIRWGAESYRSRDVMKAIAPISKSVNELSWKPKIYLKDGLKMILEAK